MINKNTDAANIIDLATATFIKGNKYYQEQCDVSRIPGVGVAIEAMARRYNVPPDIIGLIMGIGVYLTLRLKETERLERQFGG